MQAPPLRSRRINVSFSDDELSALMHIAFEECRDVATQTRYLVRQEAARRGLLATGIDAEGSEIEEEQPAQTNPDRHGREQRTNQPILLS